MLAIGRTLRQFVTQLRDLALVRGDDVGEPVVIDIPDERPVFFDGLLEG